MAVEAKPIPKPNNPVEQAGGFIARYADWIMGLGVLGLMTQSA